MQCNCRSFFLSDLRNSISSKSLDEIEFRRSKKKIASFLWVWKKNVHFQFDIHPYSRAITCISLLINAVSPYAISKQKLVGPFQPSQNTVSFHLNELAAAVNNETQMDEIDWLLKKFQGEETTWCHMTCFISRSWLVIETTNTPMLYESPPYSLYLLGFV